MKLEEAIQQPVFDTQRTKAGINILYTASWFSHIMMQLLKPHGISWQQYNIMRILRGQKGKPASLKLVTERMIDQMSNTSRLIDKLLDKGLVERKQCPNDRRQVDLWLTPAGTELVEKAQVSIDAHMLGVFQHISDDKLVTLNALLDELRN